jgi:hypothetical protein
MWHRVGLIRTDLSEESVTSIFRIEKSSSEKKALALYSCPSNIRIIKIRRMRWAGHVTRMGETRNAYRLLVGKPEGRRPLGRPRRR